MTISLGNAIKSVREDEHWVKKTLIGSVIAILCSAGIGIETKGASIGIIIAGILMYLFFGSIIAGFIVSTANAQLNNNLKGWTEIFDSKNILQGLKFIFSYIVYGIAVTLIFAFITTVITIASGIILGLIYYFINFVITIPSELIAIIGTITITTLAIILTIYLMQFLAAAFVCYCKNMKFHDFMALKKQFRIIAENQHASWTLVGKTILYTLLFTLILIVFTVTIIGIIAIPFIYFAAGMILINLYVQYGKEIDIGKYL